MPDIVIQKPEDFANIVLAVGALKELQQYREALRFRPFDDIPEIGADVEFITKDGEIDAEHIRHLRGWNSNKKYYAGWRYIIGDLIGEVAQVACYDMGWKPKGENN